MSNDFSMPWSAHDVAGAIRETLAATRAGAKLFELTGAAYSRRKARQAAGRLDGLAFLPDGLKEPLARIAAAEHSTEDIQFIMRMFSDSAHEVEKCLEKLREYGGRFREERGLATTLQLYDEVLWGKVGKQGIREEIRNLIRAAEASPPDTAKMQAAAQNAVQMIEVFNEQLSRLHDLVLPPKKRTNARLKREKPSA